MRVSKNWQSWQQLECFLSTEMLICIKEKRNAPLKLTGNDSARHVTKCTLKGSIMLNKHLEHVEADPDRPLLTLKLSIEELGQFYLSFQNREQADQWQKLLAENGLEIYHEVDQVRHVSKKN